MSEINVLVGSNWRQEDLGRLFNDGPVWFSKATDYSVLLRELGVYPSSSAARRAGREGPIPEGYAELKASKTVMLYIWNPTIDHEDQAHRLILNGAVRVRQPSP